MLEGVLVSAASLAAATLCFVLALWMMNRASAACPCQLVFESKISPFLRNRIGHCVKMSK
jgi:hypothetical protein